MLFLATVSAFPFFLLLVHDMSAVCWFENCRLKTLIRSVIVVSNKKMKKDLTKISI